LPFPLLQDSLHACSSCASGKSRGLGGEVSSGVKQELRRKPTASQRARVKSAAGWMGGAVNVVAYCVQKVNKGSAYTTEPRL